MHTTERAAQKLKDDLVRRSMNEGIGYRVKIIAGKDEMPRSDLSMRVDRALPTDEVVECHGIRLILDPASASVLDRFELDYKEEPGSFYLVQRDQV